MNVNIAPPMTMTPAPWARREFSVRVEGGLCEAETEGSDIKIQLRPWYDRAWGPRRGGRAGGRRAARRARSNARHSHRTRVRGPPAPGERVRTARPMPPVGVAARRHSVRLSAKAPAEAVPAVMHPARSGVQNA